MTVSWLSRPPEIRRVAVLADTHKVSIKAIQRILRHSNLSTTERYIENMDTDMKATLNLLSKNDAEREMTHFLTHDKNKGVSHDS